MKYPKIALIGAGNIGGTMGFLAQLQELGDVVMIDIAPGIPAGKALDLNQASPLLGKRSKIVGGNSFELIADADVIIVTAGSPRKPGMNSRDELLSINTRVISQVAQEIKTYAPNAFVIVVTNPLDAMVWVMQHASELPPEKVVGMAGILDTARLRFFLSERLEVSADEVQALVVGGHGDTMVPLKNYISVGGIPLTTLEKMGVISDEEIQGIFKRTREGGSEIVNLMGTSAYYAVASSALHMAKSYLRDEKRILTAASWLRGEFGIKDLYVGVPVIIGASGVEKILEIPLHKSDLEALHHSADAVRHLIEDIERLKLLNPS